MTIIDMIKNYCEITIKQSEPNAYSSDMSYGKDCGRIETCQEILSIIQKMGQK